MAFMDYPTPIDDGTMAAAPSGVAPTAAPGVDPVAALMQQAAAAKRKQDLAQLLLQHAGSQGSQGQMMGGIYVPPSPLSPINKAMAELGGVYAAKKGWDSQDALSTKLMQAKGNEIAQMMANPAVADQYIASPDPTLSKLAETIVKNREEHAKNTITNVDGNLVATNQFNPQPQKLGYFGAKYGNPYKIGEDLYVTDLNSNKPDQLNKASKTSITMAAPNVGQVEAVKGLTDMLEKNRMSVLQAPNEIADLQRARQLIHEGLLKGSLTAAQNVIGQTIASVGGDPGTKVNNYNEYKAIMAPLVLEEVRKLAPVTDTDRAYIESMKGADPKSMSDATLLRLIDIAERSKRMTVNEYNRARKQYAGIVGAGTSDPALYKDIYPTPDLPPEQPDTAPSSVEDLSTPEGRLAAARARGLIK